MKNIFKNLKKKKGFTLVEVIIVLVIIAILAAVLIPSLAGYIDKANQKVAVANARNFTMAAQTVFSEAYGEHGALKTTLTADEQKDYVQKAFDLAELSNPAFYVEVTVTTKGKVESVNFYDGTFKVTYTGGKFTVTEDATSETTTDTVTVKPVAKT